MTDIRGRYRRILILGGYGNTGRHIAHLLLAETEVHLVLAGRSRESADLAAVEFNRIFAGERVAGAVADAADSASLERACDGVDLVIAASSTARYAVTVARMALRAGIDYLDIHFSPRKVTWLQAMSGEIENAGRRVG